MISVIRSLRALNWKLNGSPEFDEMQFLILPNSEVSEILGGGKLVIDGVALDVEGVRDLVKQPLLPEEFRQFPFAKRGRYLVLVRHDQGFSQYYIGTSSEPHLKLGEIVQGRVRPWASQTFSSSQYDRELLWMCLEKFEHDYQGDFCVYVDELAEHSDAQQCVNRSRMTSRPALRVVG